MRWQVRKARYPVDPSRAWMAIPGNSTMRARRFATFEEAIRFVAAKTRRRSTP